MSRKQFPKQSERSRLPVKVSDEQRAHQYPVGSSLFRDVRKRPPKYWLATATAGKAGAWEEKYLSCETITKRTLERVRLWS